MATELTLFLAHSFATDPIDSTGVTDAKLAEDVKGLIETLSHGRIKVVTTKDPLIHYISSQVRADIGAADITLCLFTKRVKDHVTGEWITSTYVISEGAAAFAQLESERDSQHRLFGLMEQGVDRSQLGMAFHGNKTLRKFERGRRDQLSQHVAAIVDEVLDWHRVSQREEREYLRLDKTVTVWRSGAVMVECRHTFRLTRELRRVSLPHTIWRISQKLPQVRLMLNTSPAQGSTFLHCYPTSCGRQEQNPCTHHIRPRETLSANEQNFQVEISDLSIPAGDQLAYEVCWGYPNAFQDPTHLPPGEPNSVGMRTGDRGRVLTASLTLKFERVWSVDDALPTLEEAPKVFITDAVHLPAAHTAIEFWHHSPERWRPAGEMRRCRRDSGALFDVYRWSISPFQGMAKATWTPSFNYFQSDMAIAPADALATLTGTKVPPPGPAKDWVV